MRVRIPSPLYSYTRSRADVDARGASVAEVLLDLDRQFSGIRFRMVDEQDHIRRHIKIFINQTQVFDLCTPVSPQDELVIVQAFSGG